MATAKTKTVGDKVLEILGSVRFWILTLTAALALLEASATGGLTPVYAINTVQVWLAAVVGVGTLDSVASKFAGKK